MPSLINRTYTHVRVSFYDRCVLVAPRRSAIYSVVLLASAQIAIPLSPDHESGLTGITVVLLAFSTLLFARMTLKTELILTVFVLSAAISLLIEAIGVRTGWPFGHYAYSGRLNPRIVGVPVIVPIAWFSMTLGAREVARNVVGPRWGQWLVGGWLLAGWDLFLDPQMTRAGFWIWRGTDWWQGVPFSNYLGWFVIGTGLVALVDVVLVGSKANRGLVFTYFWMVFMATFGFVLPIAFDRPIVGLVGGIATLPFATYALIRRTPPWLASQ